MDRELLEIARRFEALLDYEFRDTFAKDPARLGAAVMSSVAREQRSARVRMVNESLSTFERTVKRRENDLAALRFAERRAKERQARRTKYL